MSIKRIIPILMLCACMLQAPAQVFVSSSLGNDGNSGQTWETAKRTLPAALSVIVDSTGVGSGDVYMMVGDYGLTAEVTIPAGVTVRGGYRTDSHSTDTNLRRFPGVNSRWTDTTYCSIISGAGTHRIAWVGGVIDGCVVRNGYTDGFGGGLFLDGGIARHCVIKECDAIDPLDGTARGGGVYVRNNAQLLNCVVTQNRADDGAGVAGSGSTLINNTITNNTPLGCGPVQDYDGNVYKTVVIGDQCWMRESLRTTHFSDGTYIPLYTSGDELANTLRFDGYYNFMNAEILQKYGYLYNGYAVLGLAPATSTAVYNMPVTGWDTVTTCGMRIYDNGGENANYTSSCNGYLVVLPGVEGQQLSLSGRYVTENCCDKLYVYDGVGTDNLIGEYGGTGVFSVNSTAGALTLRFYSDGSSQYAGLYLEVKCGTDSLKNLCPDGWHVPTDAELTQLTNYVGAQPKYRCGNNANSIVKALSNNSGWANSNSQCCVGYQQQTQNNATWFSAYPTGYKEYSGTSYYSFGEFTSIWSSTRSGSELWQREYYYYSSSFTRHTRNMSYGFSVRCLKND